MAELTAIAKDLGATTSFSAAQAAEGLGFLAQAGFDATEAGKALPGVLQLAAAGGIELAAAADIATNVLAGYGLEVDQLARVNDVLAKASSSANTDVLQLGQAFKFAGPVARSAGISFEQSGAAMALMGNAGIQAEMAGTALRGAITKLVNPSKEAATTMAELGISATDSEGRLRPLDEIIEQLAPHADNTGAIMQIFGQRAGPAMAALVSQGADALREMTTALEQSGGTAQEIAEKKLAGLTGAWTRLQSATEGVFIEIGSRLSPVLERLAATITDRILPAVRDALDAFGRLSPEVQTSRILWLGFAAALGPALLAIGGVALALTPLVPLFGRIWIAAGRMSNALVKALGHPIATAQALRARIVTLRTSLTGLSLSARASAVGVKLASVALTGLRFAIRGVIAALGPMIAVFAAFEFAAWAAGALDLGGKLKRLVGITDDAADAARDADAACEGLNDTLTDTAETVETVWVRRIQDLEQAMLMGTASIGQLDAEIRHALQSVNITDDVILALASALRYTAVAAGEHLTPAMQEIIDRADEITRTAKESAAGIDDLSESATGAGQPVDDLGDGVGTLSEEVQALVDRLRGTGAIQAAHDWAAAVEDVGGLTRLTDQQTADLNETLQAALSAYQQLGDEAPARLVALAAETGRAVARMREPLQGLVDDVFSLQAVAATSRQALADLITTQGLVGNVQFGRTLASTPMAIDTLGVTVPVLVKPEFDLRTTGQKLPEQLSKSFAGFGDQIGPTFVRALEGGGQWRGAMQSLGVQGGTRLGEALSGGLATTMATETSVFSKGIGQFFGQGDGAGHSVHWADRRAGHWEDFRPLQEAQRSRARRPQAREGLRGHHHQEPQGLTAQRSG